GMVYTALDRYRGDRVAIKLEAIDRLSSLQIEAKRLEQLGGSIAPSCRKLGTDKDFRYIALELLGPTLNTMRRLSPNRCLNTETLLRLTSKLLRALEQLHACGIVHQDLKPDNIVIDAANPDVVKFIDFGVSTTYITPQGQHVQPGTVRCVAGTPFYSSLKSQGGSIPTRRDDLESLVYTLVHLGCGSLPWFDSNLTAQQITTLKVQHSDAICRYLPPEFGQLLGYARGLRFDQKPDYKHWATVFDQRYAVLQRSHDGLMQWAAQ
ncbi:kinase-like protein, partial [Fistulina hepatica ATCC 64428]